MSPESTNDCEPSVSRITSESSFFAASCCVVLLRPKYIAGDISPRECVALLQVNDTNAAPLRECKNVAVNGDVDIPPHPKFLDSEIFEHSGKPADVVYMRVGERNNVHLFQSARPQIGRDYIFSNIDSGMHAPGVNRPQRAPGIDQHRVPIWKSGKQAVTLSDIQHGQFEIFPCEMWREGMRRDQRRGGYEECR